MLYNNNKDTNNKPHPLPQKTSEVKSLYKTHLIWRWRTTKGTLSFILIKISYGWDYFYWDYDIEKCFYNSISQLIYFEPCVDILKEFLLCGTGSDLGVRNYFLRYRYKLVRPWWGMRFYFFFISMIIFRYWKETTIKRVIKEKLTDLYLYMWKFTLQWKLGVSLC